MLNARMPVPEIDELDEAADRLGISRSELVRSLCRYGLPRLQKVFPKNKRLREEVTAQAS